MLRVGGEASSFLSVDKKRKQMTLQEPPTLGDAAAAAAASDACDAADDRRVRVAAPKMFAFDGVFTQDDAQVNNSSFLYFGIDYSFWVLFSF